MAKAVNTYVHVFFLFLINFQIYAKCFIMKPIPKYHDPHLHTLIAHISLITLWAKTKQQSQKCT